MSSTTFILTKQQTKINTELVDRRRRPVRPPTISKGVEITADRDGGMVLDWLAFTLHGELVDCRGIIQDLFGGMVARPVGWLSYRCSAYVLGTGRVGWHPEQPQQGVHVSLPAGALGQWAAEKSNDVLGLLEYLRALGATFKRVDVALDDRVGALDLDRVGHYLVNGDFACRAHKKNILLVQDLAGGRTYYAGAPSSDKKIRIYDKAAERRAAGEKVKGHWVRCEIQTRSDVAGGVVDLLLDDPADVMGFIRSFLEFKAPGSDDTNVTRRDPAGWWLAFLRFASKKRVLLPKAHKTIDDLRRWIERQIMPSLSLVVQADGGDLGGWLLSGLVDGKARWNSRHKALLELAAV